MFAEVEHLIIHFDHSTFSLSLFVWEGRREMEEGRMFEFGERGKEFFVGIKTRLDEDKKKKYH